MALKEAASIVFDVRDVVSLQLEEDIGVFFGGTIERGDEVYLAQPKELRIAEGPEDAHSQRFVNFFRVALQVVELGRAEGLCTADKTGFVLLVLPKTNPLHSRQWPPSSSPYLPSRYARIAEMSRSESLRTVFISRGRIELFPAEFECGVFKYR